MLSRRARATAAARSAAGAVAGRLVGIENRPVGNAQGEAVVGNERRALMTARDGSFYLEQMEPGRYEGEAHTGAGRCRFALQVPPSEDPVSEIGQVTCE